MLLIINDLPTLYRHSSTCDSESHPEYRISSEIFSHCWRNTVTTQSPTHVTSIDIDWDLYGTYRLKISRKNFHWSVHCDLYDGGTSPDASTIAFPLRQWSSAYPDLSFLRAGSIDKMMCACCESSSAISVRECLFGWKSESSSFHHLLKYSRWVSGESLSARISCSITGDTSGFSSTENLICCADLRPVFCPGWSYIVPFLILRMVLYMKHEVLSDAVQRRMSFGFSIVVWVGRSTDLKTDVGTSMASSTTMSRSVLPRIPFAQSFSVRKCIRTPDSLFWMYRFRSFTVNVHSSKLSMKSNIYSPIDSVVSCRNAHTIRSFHGIKDSSITFSAMVSDFHHWRDQSTTIIFAWESIKSFCHCTRTGDICHGIFTWYEYHVILRICETEIPIDHGGSVCVFGFSRINEARSSSGSASSSENFFVVFSSGSKEWFFLAWSSE